MSLRKLWQPCFCVLGVHVTPPPRNPPGPVVSTCPCCGRVTYAYGLSLQGIGSHPQMLMLPSYPKVLGTIASTYA